MHPQPNTAAVHLCILAWIHLLPSVSETSFNFNLCIFSTFVLSLFARHGASPVVLRARPSFFLLTFFIHFNFSVLRRRNLKTASVI